MNKQETHYGILDLVEATGINRRTIRYYVQMELLPPPLGAGRGHYYLREHLDRLLKIRDLQNKGLSLEEIRTHDQSEVSPQWIQADPSPEIERVTRIVAAPGIELLITDGATTPTPSEIKAIALATTNILSKHSKKG